MQSSPQTQTPFNGIRGLKNIQGFFPLPKIEGFNSSDTISNTKQGVERFIDDLKYADGMLYAYDGEEKGVRRQLRRLISDSRENIIYTLRKLNAPDFLTNKLESDNIYDWMEEIEAWLREIGPLRINIGSIFKAKSNGDNGNGRKS